MLDKLPFTHLVWFMENGDDSWRICAATMDESDAKAVRANILKDGCGDAMVTLINDKPAREFR